MFVPEYRKSSGLKSLPKSTTINAPLLFCESFPAVSTSCVIVVDAALNSFGGFPSNTANLPVPNNSINLLSSPCHKIAKEREQANTTASINFEVKGRYAYLCMNHANETKNRYPLRSHKVLCSLTLENNNSPNPRANKTSNKNFKFINPQKFTLKSTLI